MQGDGIVSLVACLSLLAGLVIGLRFNVRLLMMVCLAALVVGAVAPLLGRVGMGTSLLMAAVAVLSLQVGYFVAVVIGAMQLADEPVAAPVTEAKAERHGRDGAEGQRI